MIYEQKTKLKRRKRVVAPFEYNRSQRHQFPELKKKLNNQLIFREILCILILNDAFKVLLTVYDEHL
jgi:hypothetical protein